MAKRRSRAEWAALVSKQQRSGLSQVDFARQERLCLTTLRYWLRRKRQEQAAEEGEASFIQVVQAQERSAPGETLMELPGGVRMRMASPPEPGYVAVLAWLLSLRDPAC